FQAWGIAGRTSMYPLCDCNNISMVPEITPQFASIWKMGSELAFGGKMATNRLLSSILRSMTCKFSYAFSPSKSRAYILLIQALDQPTYPVRYSNLLSMVLEAASKS